MSWIHQLWKFLVVAFVILWHVMICLAARLFLQGEELRAFCITMVHRHARAAMGVLGIKVTIEGAENWDLKRNYLVVANHMSYLEGLIFTAHAEACFVTSVEMHEMKGLGLLTEVGGCLYVERRSKENIQNEIRDMVQGLKNGHNVVLFPEATSTNGEKVIPFKRSLFTASPLSGKTVLPVVLQYDTINGEKVTISNRDLLCWYGDMDFLPHFFRLAGLQSVGARLKVLPELPLTPETNRDTLVEQAYAAISGRYEPIQ